MSARRVLAVSRLVCGLVFGAVGAGAEAGNVEGHIQSGPRPIPSRETDSAGVRQPRLRLVWLDPARAADGVSLWAREESARLLSSMGLEAEWRQAAAGDPVADDELRVIVLDSVARADDGALVLGATPPGAGARFVWIHAESVRATLGGRSGPAPDFASRRRLGLALGRVITHELVHALAPAVPHGAGLMADRLGRRELETSHVAIAAEVSTAMRRAASGPTAEDPALSPGGAPVAAVADVPPRPAAPPDATWSAGDAGWSAH